jgi:hypothetical protein
MSDVEIGSWMLKFKLKEEDRILVQQELAKYVDSVEGFEDLEQEDIDTLVAFIEGIDGIVISKKNKLKKGIRSAWKPAGGALRSIALSTPVAAGRASVGAGISPDVSARPSRPTLPRQISEVVITVKAQSVSLLADCVKARRFVPRFPKCLYDDDGEEPHEGKVTPRMLSELVKLPRDQSREFASLPPANIEATDAAKLNTLISCQNYQLTDSHGDLEQCVDGTKRSPPAISCAAELSNPTHENGMYVWKISLQVCLRDMIFSLNCGCKKLFDMLKKETVKPKLTRMAQQPMPQTSVFNRSPMAGASRLGSLAVYQLHAAAESQGHSSSLENCAR